MKINNKFINNKFWNGWYKFIIWIFISCLILILIFCLGRDVIWQYFADRKIKEGIYEYYSQLPKNEEYGSFVFFADSHWGVNRKNTPFIIKKLFENTEIDKFIYGGDIVTNVDPSKTEMRILSNNFYSQFAFLGKNFYTTFGNHDDNSHLQEDSTQILSIKEMGAIAFRNNNINNFCHKNYSYFFDSPEEDTRYFIMDSHTYSISPEEIDFMVSSIDTCSMKNIGVITHMTYRDEKSQTNPNLKNFINVLDSINQESNKKIDFILSAHIHKDDVTFTKSGIPNISIDADAYKKSQLYRRLDFMSIKEQSVSIVINDFNNDLIKIIRIGRGKSFTIDKKNKIVKYAK